MVSFVTAEPQFRAADVALPRGLRLQYLHGGPISGPAVLMLHGITDSSFSFSRVLPLAPAHLRLVVPDQRGHGRSDRPESGYTVDDFALDALQLLDALAIEQATVIGHSMGGFVARRMAERAPWRVGRLILIGSAITCQTQAVRELAEAAKGLTDPVDEAFVREFQLSTLGRPVPPEFLARVIAESRTVPARVWKDALAGLIEWEPRWPITCPTRILGGELDAIFSRDEQAALFHRTERATFQLEPGVGHALHWESPERFASLAFSGL